MWGISDALARSPGPPGFTYGTVPSNMVVATSTSEVWIDFTTHLRPTASPATQVQSSCKFVNVRNPGSVPVTIQAVATGATAQSSATGTTWALRAITIFPGTAEEFLMHMSVPFLSLKTASGTANVELWVR